MHLRLRVAASTRSTGRMWTRTSEKGRLDQSSLHRKQQDFRPVHTPLEKKVGLGPLGVVATERPVSLSLPVEVTKVADRRVEPNIELT